jgi:hypothetical protein
MTGWLVSRSGNPLDDTNKGYGQRDGRSKERVICSLCAAINLSIAGTYPTKKFAAKR